jgi:hypothetical protein
MTRNHVYLNWTKNQLTRLVGRSGFFHPFDMTAGAALTRRRLRSESQDFEGTGGVSENNRPQGFRPAFRDTSTGQVYASRYADGRPAAMHLLDGLPDTLVLDRAANGHVVKVRPTVVAGFERSGRFYTREEAASAACRE